LRRRPGAARFNSDASVALRVSNGLRRSVAVQFDQVEGVEEDVAVMAALAQPLEHPRPPSLQATACRRPNTSAPAAWLHG
jgi:hypothetical protein